MGWPDWRANKMVTANSTTRTNCTIRVTAIPILDNIIHVPDEISSSASIKTLNLLLSRDTKTIYSVRRTFSMNVQTQRIGMQKPKEKHINSNN